MDGSETVNSKCRLRENPIAQGLDSFRAICTPEICAWSLLSVCTAQKVCFIYRDRRQDVALEIERNQAAAKQSQVRPSNQLLLSSLHFLRDILVPISVQ